MAFFQQRAIADLAPGKRAVAQAIPAERLAFLKKVYGLLFASTIVGIGGGVIGVLNADKVIPYWWLLFVLFFVTYFATYMVRKKEGINTMMLFIFTFVSGLVLAPLLTFVLWQFEMDGPVIIGEALGLTFAAFAGLTAYVFLAKKDFSAWGGALMMGLFMLIIGGFIGIFIGGPAYHLAISVLGVVIFGGFILYDTSMIMKRYQLNEHVAAALTLYIDLFYMFIYILRILIILAVSRD
jgi:modulator of FtsH protease